MQESKCNCLIVDVLKMYRVSSCKMWTCRRTWYDPCSVHLSNIWNTYIYKMISDSEIHGISTRCYSYLHLPSSTLTLCQKGVFYSASRILISYHLILRIYRDRDSSVGIADSLQAGRSQDRIPVVARFSAPIQTGPGAHPASYTMGTGSFPGVKRPGRGVDHPLHLAQRLKEE